MRITGTSMLTASPEAVFAALNDPAVLATTIPGCRRLEALGGDAYAMTVAAGVGSIKGVYDGQVRLTDQDAPTSFRLHATGSGAPGTIAADVLVTLEPTAAGSSLTYNADAAVGGMIGGVGQRMLVGVSKRLAAEFFGNVDALLSADAGAAALPDGLGAPRPSGLPPDPSTVAPSPSVRSTPPAGTLFAPPSGERGGSGFALGVAVGAGAALAGAVAGAWISRRALT